MELSNSTKNRDLVQDFFENFNLRLFLYVVKRSKLFLIIALLTCLIIPILIIRYTTPIYETTAALIKKKEIKNNLLDEKSTEFLKSNDEEKINRDIQIIRSDFLLNGIADSLGLNISYSKRGKLHFKKFEFLGNSNFQIADGYIVKNPNLYNQDIDVSLKNGKFNLSYKIGEKENKIKSIPINNNFENSDIKFRLLSSLNVKGDFILRFNDRDAIKNYVISNLNIISGSPNIFFSIRGADAAKAEMVLQKILNGFLRVDQNENSEKVENSLRYIAHFIDTLNAAVDKSQIEQTHYSIQNNIYAPQQQLSNTLQEIEDYKIKLDDAEVKLFQLENLSKKNGRDQSYEEIKGGDQEIRNLILERNKLSLDLKQNHPTIRFLESEISKKITEKKAAIQSEMLTYQNFIRTIRNRSGMAASNLKSYPEKNLEIARIQKQLELKEKYVIDLLEKQIQYLILKSSITSDYLIIQPPKTKGELVSPKKNILYSGFGILFVLFSTTLCLYRYIRFDKIVSLDEVKRNTKVPILGYVPFVKEAFDQANDKRNAPESRIVVVKNPKSRTAEVFKKMRASLKYTSAGEYKVIASTSTTSGEGKTFVLINLAAVHALLDKKVLLIDLDLRKPRISKSLKLNNDIGMSSLLSSNTPIADCIQKSNVLENLDVITSGPIPPNPSELIISNKFSLILEELKKQYDYIFIDTPPVGLVNESIELINKADIPLYLIRFNYSKKNFLGSLNELAELQKGKNPLFLVINHFGDGASSYINYDYGGYGYHYGYGYHGDKSESYHSKIEGYYTDSNQIERSSLKERISQFFDYKL